MSHTPTPHNSAKQDDFAATVLMPGDPLRARFVAEHYLEGAKLVNNVRGVQGYTGNYQGTRISVMASGMGMPSMAIYSYELFKFYNVQQIIRIGSAGAMQEHIRIRDLILGMGACTDSAYAAQYQLTGTFAPIADFTLLRIAAREAEKMELPFHVGNLLSSDAFYNENAQATQQWKKMGVLAVEMEAAALYMNAARCGKRALAMCTVSDHLLNGIATSSEERESSFTQMMELALNTAVTLEQMV